MGIIVHDEVKMNNGLSLRDVYVSVGGHGTITKHKVHKRDQYGQIMSDATHYRVQAVASVWLNKDAYLQGLKPIINTISVQSNEITDVSVLEEQGGILKNIVYPLLRSMLKVESYTDD